MAETNLAASCVAILGSDGRVVSPGFLTRGGWIVTTAHVVQQAGSGPGGTLQVVYQASGKQGGASVQADYWRDPEAEDLAALRPWDRPPEAVPLEVGPLAAPGGEFQVFGFKHADVGITGRCEVTGRGTVRNRPVLQLRSADIGPGFSGSPVLSPDGMAVGMVVASYRQPEQDAAPPELAFALPAETLLQVCPALNRGSGTSGQVLGLADLGRLDEALALAREQEDLVERVDLLSSLAREHSEDVPDEIWDEVLAAVASTEEERKVVSIERVALALPAARLGQALDLARGLADPQAMARAVLALARRLPPSDPNAPAAKGAPQPPGLADAVAAAGQIADEAVREQTLRQLEALRPVVPGPPGPPGPQGPPGPDVRQQASSVESTPPATAPEVEVRQERAIELARWALSDRADPHHDLLGFDAYADALAEFISSGLTSRPLTIGIDAPWGTGKTTLMRMLRLRLDPEAESRPEGRSGAASEEDAGASDPGAATSAETQGQPVAAAGKEARKATAAFPTVWFDAWKYDKEGSLWAALLLSMLRQVRQRMRERQTWGKQLRFWAKLYWKRLDRPLLLRSALKAAGYFAGVAALGLAVLALVWGAAAQPAVPQLNEALKALGGAGLLAALFGAAKEIRTRVGGLFDLRVAAYLRAPDYEERLGFFDRFKADFDVVLDSVTDSGRWPLVLFIDDLDRCSPPKPVEVIEAINNLLDTEHCVFILGMDADAVAASIEAKYRDLAPNLPADPGGLSLGQRFLEKIVQIHFRIPRAEPQQFQEFIHGILAGPDPAAPTALTASRVEQGARLIEAERRAERGLPVEAAAEKARAEARKQSPDLQPVIEQAMEVVRAKEEEEKTDVEAAVAEAARYLEFNPRKIKRFINIFRLQAMVARRRGLLGSHDPRLTLLARSIVLASRWPDFLDAVMADPAFIDRLLEAARLQRDLREVRSQKPRNFVEERRLRSDIAAQTADPRIKQLVAAGELVELLEMVGVDGRGQLLRYLHIAHLAS